MRPLHMLAFLAPLVIAYEIGSIFALTDTAAGIQRSVEAYKVFADFFHVFGLVGLFLPGVALVTVLLVWHAMVRDRWAIDPRTLAGMGVESLAWTLPLLVLAAAADYSQQQPAPVPPQALAAVQETGAALHHLPLAARLTVAIGAGLYEEMLFRLVGIALLHFILVDLIGLGQRWGISLAVGLAALAFALYHRPDLPQEWPTFLFFIISGIYLGAVYSMRGFGIAVGTHALYDVIVLVVFPALTPPG